MQQIPTKSTARGFHLSTRQPLILPSLTEGSANETTGPERHESATNHSQYSSEAPAGPIIKSGFQAIGDFNETHPFSQWRRTSHVPTPCVDLSADTSVGAYMENPASHDLLEWLTMFENTNWYVGGRRWLGPLPPNDHPLTTNSHDRQYMEPLGYVGGLHHPN